MNFELTLREIHEAVMKAIKSGNSEYEAIAKAQDAKTKRKLVEWLHEKCYKHNGGLLRLGCPECWRELDKGVGL